MTQPNGLEIDASTLIALDDCPMIPWFVAVMVIVLLLINAFVTRAIMARSVKFLNATVSLQPMAVCVPGMDRFAHHPTTVHASWERLVINVK